MEEETRQILNHFLLPQKSAMGIGARISRRFAEVGGIDLQQVPRSYPRHLPDVDVDESQ